jgi:hypothetical protein
VSKTVRTLLAIATACFLLCAPSAALAQTPTMEQWPDGSIHPWGTLARLRAQQAAVAAAAARAAANQAAAAQQVRQAQAAEAAAEEAAREAKARADAAAAAAAQARIRAAQEAARRAHEEFIRDRDAYAARLRDIAANDDTLRGIEQNSFSSKGTTSFDTGIRAVDPRTVSVTRLRFKSAGAHLLCGESIAGAIPTNGGDAESIHFLAEQALEALNGAQKGVPCKYAGAEKLHLTSTSPVMAAVSKVRSSLQRVKVLAARQQALDAKAKPNATPPPTATPGPDQLRDVSSGDDDNIRTASQRQQAFQQNDSKKIQQIYAQQKANEKKLDSAVAEAIAALKRAQKLQAAQGSH